MPKKELAMKNLILFAVVSVALTRLACADTSYLLIQGPFGASSTTETFEWKVNYAHGSLTTGMDLMNAVFGTPIDTGNLYQSTYEIFSAGNNIQGANYIDFNTTPGDPGTSLFTISLTLGGTTVQQTDAFDPSWNYYVAGGAGSGNAGPYPSGSWTYANDGLNSRALSDGSFDGWVFGDPSVPVTISGLSPTPTDFAGATVVNFGVVPEPSSLVFLSVGALLFLRRRR